MADCWATWSDLNDQRLFSELHKNHMSESLTIAAYTVGSMHTQLMLNWLLSPFLLNPCTIIVLDTYNKVGNVGNPLYYQFCCIVGERSSVE